jgi:hypothetical protein
MIKKSCKINCNGENECKHSEAKLKKREEWKIVRVETIEFPATQAMRNGLNSYLLQFVSMLLTDLIVVGVATVVRTPTPNPQPQP